MSTTLVPLTINTETQTKLVDSLQSAQNALLEQVKQAGIQLGIKSAPNLSYKELRRIARTSKLNLTLDEDALSSLLSFLEFHGLKLDENELDLVLLGATSKVAFVNGWIEGVLYAAWNGLTGR
ncbi:MAG TPA: hypothetical protein V6D33_11190 [Cyanophyceae cyanobacterium]